MRKGGGKSKGSAFERKVAKMIAAAFRNFGIHQRECWRSVLSGGHKISCGDLTLSPRLEKLFPFSIECKHIKRIHFERFLFPPYYRKSSWPEWQWVAQAEGDVKKRPELKPLLVMKSNTSKVLVLYKNEFGYRMVEFADFLKRAVRQAKKVRK